MAQFAEDVKAFYEEYRKLAVLFYEKKQRLENDSVDVNGWNIQYVTGPVIINAINQLFIMKVNGFYTRKKNPVIIDCGANIGLSILSDKYMHPGARITAFEADPAFFKVLKRNIEHNKVPDVKLVESAVWIENGTIEWGSDNTDGSRIVDEKDHSGITSDKRKTTVKCCDIAEYLNEEVDLLKIDIEGAEYRVVKHLAEKNALKNVKNIIIECHLLQSDFKPFAETVELLKDAGFKLSINNMGRWRDLIRRPEAQPGHYEQYLLICAWKDDEFPCIPDESEYLPVMGLNLVDMQIRHEEQIAGLRADMASVNRLGKPFLFLSRIFNSVLNKFSRG